MRHERVVPTVPAVSGVTTLDRPAGDIQEADTRLKLIFVGLNLERTLDKRRREETIAKKVITLQRAVD